MRKFTNKQEAKIEQWLDEAFNDGYKAAEFDAMGIFTAEANMKSAEAEFNKRETIGFDEHGQRWYLETEQEQLGETSVIVFVDYGSCAVPIARLTNSQKTPERLAASPPLGGVMSPDA